MELCKGSDSETEITNCTIANLEQLNISCEEKDSLSVIRKDILDHLSQNKEVYFRSQQIGEPELDENEKRNIVEFVLDKSKSMFLARFGDSLLEKHLLYFKYPSTEESYEIEFYLKQIRAKIRKTASQVEVKNRRFEALKKMVTEGEYFSENEMRKRDPLLYEELVGKYLSDEERTFKENIDYTNITIVNLLYAKIDQDEEKERKRKEREEEMCAMEEEESSENDMEEDYERSVSPIVNEELWGESMTDMKPMKAVVHKTSRPGRTGDKFESCSNCGEEELNEGEQMLLMEEFRSNMYTNFLQGKDVDFDYSKVDFNPEYDNLDVCNQDEEEKYFDSESPETVQDNAMEEEDELDQFMSGLREAIALNCVKLGAEH